MIYSFVKYAKDGTTVERVFSFDVVQNFTENWQATVSKSAVESGFLISDNITLENPTFAIKGVLSSYSIFDETKEIVWNGEDFVQESQNVDLLRHITLRNDLKTLFLCRGFFTLLESENNSFESDDATKAESLKSGYSQEYRNCVLTNFSVDYTTGTNNVVFVDMMIEQLNIATVVTTELKDSQLTPRLQGLKKETVNKSNTTTSTDISGTSGKDPVGGSDTGANGEKSNDDSSLNRQLNKRVKEDIIRAENADRIVDEAGKAYAQTGIPYMVDKVGDGYRITKRE